MRNLVLAMSLFLAPGAAQFSWVVPNTNLRITAQAISVIDWGGRPAIVVVGAGAQYFEFLAPQYKPVGATSLELDVLGVAAIDNRACAPDSFLTFGDSSGAFSVGPMPPSGVLLQAQAERMFRVGHFANDPVETRWSLTYCLGSGCMTRCQSPREPMMHAMVLTVGL